MTDFRANCHFGSSAFRWCLLSLCLSSGVFLHPLHAANANPEGEFVASYAKCRTISEPVDRLRCYDGLGIPDPEDPPHEKQLIESLVTPLDAEENRRRQKKIAELDSLITREERGRLSADEPNYFVYATPIDDDIDDDRHLEFFLSLKYPLVDQWFKDLQDDFKRKGTDIGDFQNAVTPDRMLLHYSGLYDFYAVDTDRYDSAPVISRRQNPGVSFEYDYSEGRKTLRVGWFHESNGQQMESDELERFLQNREEEGEDYALATVSRGWDYAMIRWASNSLLYEDPLDREWFNYAIETRFYCDCQGFGFVDGREDAIWWEEDTSTEITDFDGLRVMAERSFLVDAVSDISLDARLDLQTGLESSFGQYLSGRLTLGAKFDNLRLTAFYFNGYGRDLSTYHLRTEYAGFGLELR